MRHAIVKDGTVINIIDYATNLSNSRPDGIIDGAIAIASDTAQIGFTYDGEFHGSLSKSPVPTYSENRATEYPPIGDQLDALFHAGVFPADMAAKIQAVKDKYPKG
jgi:hypothetical protein